MKIKIATIILALGFSGAKLAFAHADHAPPKVISQEAPKPTEKETVAKAEIVARKSIAESAAKPKSKLAEWATADGITFDEKDTLKVSYDIAPTDWRLKFTNSKATQKKELFVFVSADGSRVLGMNFNGK